VKEISILRNAELGLSDLDGWFFGTSYLAQDRVVAGFCEHGDEPSDDTEDGEFLE
jgi:hypothetical protein